MAATETADATSARPSRARRTRRSSPGRAATSTTSTRAGDAVRWRSSAAPTRTRGSTKVDVSKARGGRGRRRRLLGRRPRRATGPAALPCAWPVTEDIEDPEPLAARDRQGALRRRRRRRRRRRDAGRSRRTPPSSSRSSTSRSRPSPTSRRRREDGAPVVHDEFGTNVSYTWALAAGEVDRLFAEAAVTVKERYRQQRLIPNAIEPRGVLVQPSPPPATSRSGRRRRSRTSCARRSRSSRASRRRSCAIVAPDVGGGFGSKLDVYAEEALCLALARRLGRPVKWIEERSEGYLATIHGRDVIQEIELAATAEGKITAVRVRLIAAMGAYLQLVTPGHPAPRRLALRRLLRHAGATTSTARGVFTNTTPTDAYRGAGRPEATYAIERAMDALARKLGKDPVEIRRLNFIKEFPATIASGLEIDSGDFDARARPGARAPRLRRAPASEQAERNERGDAKRLGIGFSTYVEMCGLAPSRILGALRYGAGGWDAATVRCLPTGTVQVDHRHLAARPGPRRRRSRRSSPTGSASPIDDVEVLHGDTAVSPLGMDTYGSRSLAVGGVALWHATEKIIDEGAQRSPRTSSRWPRTTSSTRTAASPSRAPTRRMTVDGGRVRGLDGAQPPGRHGAGPRGDRTSTTRRTSAGPAAATSPSSRSTRRPATRGLVRYVAVDDVGNVINPMIVDGQVHGGIAQGVAQALYEEAVYDDDGNLVTGSMTSYLVPSAAELPSFELDRVAAPSPTNPMGVKGVGETGTIASTAGRDERRRRRARAARRHTTSTCRPRPSESGARSRRCAQ